MLIWRMYLVVSLGVLPLWTPGTEMRAVPPSLRAEAAAAADAAEELMRVLADDALAVITIWQEARGEDITGKVAVGEVILNRMRSKTHTDGTVAGTILKDRQFSGWNNTDPNRIPSVKIDDEDPVVQECIRAWNTAKSGSNFTRGATFYANLAIVKPAWLAEMTPTITVGQHTFFVPKKRDA